MNLKDYIQGKRKGKDANRLEREAMNNPFLQDALDGFDAVDGDHLSAIEMLEKEIAEKIEQKKSRVVLFRWQTLAVAASVIILLGVSGLLFLQPPTMESHYETAQELYLPAEKQIENMELALADKKDEAKQEEMIPPPPPIARNFQEITIVANEDVKMVADMDMAEASYDVYHVAPPPPMAMEELADEVSYDASYNVANKEVEVAERVNASKREDARAKAANVAKQKSAEPKPFGKAEFLAYFEENRRQNLCEGFELKFQAEFYIDEKGVPVDVKIESNCKAFQDEFTHWLNKSPKWTVTNEKILIERK